MGIDEILLAPYKVIATCSRGQRGMDLNLRNHRRVFVDPAYLDGDDAGWHSEGAFHGITDLDNYAIEN